MDNKNITVLVVDDEPEIRELIADYLEDCEGYNVLTASDGVDALERVLPENSVDIILSDINMPNMKGFELLKVVKERYPSTRRVLITAYNVEDYLELALQHDIGNIFVKTTPFNFDELTVVVNNLLTNDIFGAERYFTGKFESKELLITDPHSLDLQSDKLLTWFPQSVKNMKKIRLVLVEMLTNAIFYGIKGALPDKKEMWDHEFVLTDEEAVVVKLFKDEEKFAISVLDKGGKLSKKDVLYWLHRQIGKDETGLPLGIMDTHGRGFFIARKYIDRLVINIEKKNKTEIIIINYFDKRFTGFKPLYINEI